MIQGDQDIGLEIRTLTGLPSMMFSVFRTAALSGSAVNATVCA